MNTVIQKASLTSLDVLLHREPFARTWRPPIGLLPIDGFLAYAHFHFIQAAQAAATDAISYRNFNVGISAVIADNAHSGFTYQTGVNVKPKAGESPINIHAEDYILKTARNLGGKILMMVVVGPLQPDTQSEIATPTLHCCGRCRERFRQNSDLFDKKAVIISFTPDFTTMQLASLPGLHNFHESKGKDSSGIATITGLPKITPEMLFDVNHSSWSEFDVAWDNRKYEARLAYWNIFAQQNLQPQSALQ